MPTKVDKRGLKRRFDNLIKGAEDSRALRRLGFLVVEEIRERTRGRGKGVDRPGGRLKTLKSVSSEWALRRSRVSRHPEAATGRRSNLTFQGTLLDKLTVLKASKGDLIIGYRSRAEADKAEGQANQGREFLFLSSGEIRKFSKYFKEQILT